ncbi:MAG: hypothetical protein ACUVUP_02630 [Thermaceae bacterium]
MHPVWRWGLLYALGLFLLAALGHHNQKEARALRSMQEELARLKAEEVRLLKRYLLSSRPLEVLRWAERNGFIPMSEGRWGQ